jgi:hypothetical protein
LQPLPLWHYPATHQPQANASIPLDLARPAMQLMGMLRRCLPLALLLGLAVSFFGSLAYAAASFPHG